MNLSVSTSLPTIVHQSLMWRMCQDPSYCSTLNETVPAWHCSTGNASVTDNDSVSLAIVP